MSSIRNTFAFTLLMTSCLFATGNSAVDTGEETAIEKARVFFSSGDASQVAQGVELCVGQDDAEAARLLLEVMGWRGRPQRKGSSLRQRAIAAAGARVIVPRLRDMVWTGLERLASPAAREVVAGSAQGSMDGASVREWCVELLGGWRASEHGAAVLAALDDSEFGVRRSAARALGAMGYEPASSALKSLVHSKDRQLRTHALEALARLDAESTWPLYQEGLAEADGGVRCALLGSLAELYPEQLESLSVLALADADWRVRAQAVENLGRLRSEVAVDALVQAIRDARDAVAMRAIRALQIMSGRKFITFDEWTKWWNFSRDNVTFPASPQAPAGVATGRMRTKLGSLPVVSDHVAVWLDRSASMGDTRGNDESYLSLESLLGNLKSSVLFDLWTFGDGSRRFAETSQELKAGVAQGALAFARRVECRGKRDLWDLIGKATQDSGIDTVYLLVGGESESGLFMDVERLTQRWRELNRFEKLTLNVVALTEDEASREVLGKLAEAGGGSLTTFE